MLFAVVYVDAATNSGAKGPRNNANAKIYRPKRYHAPPRPIDAPDIDYGGVHPFDRYRHLYDVKYARRLKNKSLREEQKQTQQRQIKKKDKDEDKGNDKQQTQDENPTPPPPTPSPTPIPIEFSPIDYQGDEDQFSSSENLTLSQTSQSQPSQAQSIQQQQQQTTLSYKTTTLFPSTDHLYEPLRIQFDTSHLRSQMEISLSAGDTVAATQLYLLMYEILPMTAQVWGDVLRVIPIQGGIYPLAAQGADADVLLPTQSHSNKNDGENGENGENKREGKGYYEDPVRMLYCPDETTAGIGGGADLLIYATVNRHCDGGLAETSNNGGRGRKNVDTMGTLASALSCQRDQYDRPITGSIDFCLGGMGKTVPMDVVEAIMGKNQEASSNGESNGNGATGGVTEKWEGWFGKSFRSREEYFTAQARADGEGSGNDGSGSGVGGYEANRDIVQYSVGVAVHGECGRTYIFLPYSSF